MTPKVRTPPYGPVKGMLQGVEVMRKASPAVLDESLLKQQRIAPGNEYKVIGALRFLGLVDEEGHPTERARLLKTKGAAFALNLQTIVRDAYSELFERLDVRHASRDDVHNFFVTEAGLGAEMAAKATRFFVELCRLAEMSVAIGEAAPSARPAHGSAAPTPSAHPIQPAATIPPGFGWPIVVGLSPSVVLALTPETAELTEDELTDLLRKVQRAARRAAAEVY